MLVHRQTEEERLLVSVRVRMVNVDGVLRRPVHHGHVDPLHNDPSGHHVRGVVDPACIGRVVVERTADDKDNGRIGRKIEDELRIH